MSYRDNSVYQELENIIEAAGVKITYTKVKDDSIDGAILARSDDEGMQIIMPDGDVFSNPDEACFILGHEMGHILTGLDSPDDVITRQRNESVCNLVGVYLTRLAEMTTGNKAESSFLNELRRIGELE